MAKAKKTAAGTWHIQFEVRGQRLSGTFPTKREADEFAARSKAEVLARLGGPGAPRLGELHTLADALKKYRDEVSCHKMGWSTETKRINAFLKHPDLPSGKPMANIVAKDFIVWRDNRLRDVKASSVLRDLVILDGVFDTARRDWEWIAENPIKDLRKPPAPPHRERVIKGTEVRGMLRALGWSRKGKVRSVRQAVAWAFIMALQTGMREGELCALLWTDDRGDYLKLRSDKVNQAHGREVPVVPTTRRAIDAMKGWDDEAIIGITTKSLDAMFRKYRGIAKLEGFTFHDSRHTAATRLAQHLHLLDLCKMFGWKDPKRAMTYYNPTGKQLAERLMAPAKELQRVRG